MKFLVGYDGSNVSKAALELSREYAKALNAEIVVVVSVECDIMSRDVDVQKAKENLAYANQFITEAGISVETQLLMRGLKPGEDIVKFADENDVQAVFIGIRRRSKLDKMLFGSNASHILLNVKCPVVGTK